MSRPATGSTATTVLATTDDSVEADALLVSQSTGLVAFLLAEDMPNSSSQWADFVAEQDRLYAVLESPLGRHEGLRAGRRLAVVPNTATVFALPPQPTLLRSRKSKHC
jgi:hypothetical protein